MNSEGNLSHDRWLSGLAKGLDTLKYLIKWGAIVWVAYFVRDMVASLAGQTTVADIVVKVVATASRSQLVAWLIALGALSWGWLEMKLRRKNIKVMSGRIRELESQLDPGRSSSKLTTTGETRKEDK